MLKKTAIYLFVFLLTGCGGNFNFSGLMNLRQLSREQKQIETEIKNKERLFYKLIKDIQNERLNKGMLKEKVVYIYGEPIFSKEVINKPNIKEVLFYRHPAEFFSSDWIELYFDENNRLYSWELVPIKK